MENVLLDRSNRSLQGYSTMFNSYKGSGVRSHHNSMNTYSTCSSWSRPLPNVNGGVVASTTGFSSFPCYPPPLYSRPIISSPSLPLLPLHQPPLLPLPFSKSSSLPSLNNKVTNTISLKPRDQKKKQRAHAKEKRPSTATISLSETPRREVKDAVPKKPREVKGYTEDRMYSLSPPPSSLPLPRFSLLRPKATATSCNAEALGVVLANSGVVDTGATDDLRRLLRL